MTGEVSQAFGDEMYLPRLSCVHTACPAGVNYAELFEHARAEIGKHVLARQSGISFARLPSNGCSWNMPGCNWSEKL
jgi:glycolate oxidase iron-sulfur subunit